MLQENPSVLIVDDEKINLKLPGKLLQKDAQIMLTRHNRQGQALDKAVKHLPDLILSDVVMPATDDRGAYNVMSRCQSAIDSLRVFVDSDPGRTASIGCACISRTVQDAFGELMLKVENTLHQARQKVNNQFCWEVIAS